MMGRSILLALMLAGCASKPLEGNYRISEYGIPVWCYVDGECKPITESEQRRIVEDILEANEPKAI